MTLAASISGTWAAIRARTTGDRSAEVTGGAADAVPLIATTPTVDSPSRPAATTRKALRKTGFMLPANRLLGPANRKNNRQAD
ncbi:hypothetical protein Pen02_56650 [Plantactinospora endophytica]|uniref:Uncharacterized protein n=1 Tax=Plantactinospora endophytica TaxID=673535 RepID=A0ABQ4E7N0_9ACTN|nr:hypothetical protein Pen02_56650 [Plantactinospora endophytica]